MTHVTDKIQSWLSGELAPEKAAALEQHLQVCPACAEEAAAARRLWTELEELAAVAPANSSRASVWPAVRARTVAAGDPGVPWFFGTGRLVRSSLAMAAVAAGLILGVLLPGSGTDSVGGEAEALTVGAEQLEVAWLSDSSWGSGLSDIGSSWLSAGQESVVDADLSEAGGAK